MWKPIDFATVLHTRLDTHKSGPTEYAGIIIDRYDRRISHRMEKLPPKPCWDNKLISPDFFSIIKNRTISYSPAAVMYEYTENRLHLSALVGYFWNQAINATSPRRVVQERYTQTSSSFGILKGNHIIARKTLSDKKHIGCKCWRHQYEWSLQYASTQ